MYCCSVIVFGLGIRNGLLTFESFVLRHLMITAPINSQFNELEPASQYRATFEGLYLVAGLAVDGRTRCK